MTNYMTCTLSDEDWSPTSFSWCGLPGIDPQEFGKRMMEAYRRIVWKSGLVIDLTPKALNQIAKGVEALSNLAARPSRNGVLLMGGTGTGKTTLMGAFAEAFNAIQRAADRPQMLIVRASDVVEMAKSNPGRYSSLYGAPFLGIDDVGAESAEVGEFGNVKRPIGQLIEERYARNGIVTVMTSNNKRDSLGRLYGARVADRLAELFIPVTVSGISFRRTAQAISRQAPPEPQRSAPLLGWDEYRKKRGLFAAHFGKAASEEFCRARPDLARRILEEAGVPQSIITRILADT